jgi:hypothetical protein
MNAGTFIAKSRAARSLHAKAERIVQEIKPQAPMLTDDNGVLLARIRPEFGDVELFRSLLSLRESMRFARWVQEIREQVRQSSRRATEPAA